MDEGLGGDEEYDKGLAEAIALSLASPSSLQAVPSSGGAKSAQDEIFELSTDEEDATKLGTTRALDIAVTEHRSSSAKLTSHSKESDHQKWEKTKGFFSVPYQPTAPNMVLQRLDRKQMEAERLARLKRKAPSISPPPARRDYKSSSGNSAAQRSRKQSAPALDDDDDLTMISANGAPASRSIDITQKRSILSDGRVSELGKEKVSQPSATQTDSNAERSPLPSRKRLVNNSSAMQPVPLPEPGIQFPAGAVRKTWAFGFPRGDDIKIEEVLQKDDLKVALLSAFQWDIDWILSKLVHSKTKMILVMQAKDEATKMHNRRAAAAIPNVRFCFPSMAGNINCMHSKLQLLFHDDYLRVVVPSANLLDFDWGERGGIMENMVFLIDLPRLSVRPVRQTKDELTFFGRELLYYLEAMGLDNDIRNGVLNFDFSKTEGIAFVHTIGGSHFGENWRRTGYCGLGNAIRTLGLSTDLPIELDFVASSMGSLNDQFIKTIYLAAKGDSGLTELLQRNASQLQSRRQKSTVTGEVANPEEAQLVQQIRDHFRVYFPTRDTVIRSRGGAGNGGTICLQPQWFDSSKFPSHLFRDCKSRREGVLMHIDLRPARHDFHEFEAGSRMGVYWQCESIRECLGSLGQRYFEKNPKA